MNHSIADLGIRTLRQVQGVLRLILIRSRVKLQ
jgi:hypothetical protein